MYYYRREVRTVIAVNSIIINIFFLWITPIEHPTWREVLVERYKRKSMNKSKNKQIIYKSNKNLRNWKLLKKKYCAWNWVDFAMTWVRWNFHTFTRANLDLFDVHFDLS